MSMTKYEGALRRPSHETDFSNRAPEEVLPNIASRENRCTTPEKNPELLNTSVLSDPKEPDSP